MQEYVTKAAESLMDEHARQAQFWPFAASFRIADLEAAYAVQQEFVRRQMASRSVRPAGYKVGLTSPRMQAMCGIDRPIAGVILEDRLHSSGARLDPRSYGRLGLEFEIAVRLGRDLRPGDGPVELSDVADAVDAVCPAMEVVDDRQCDYKTLDVLSLVADNSWSAGAVLGAFQRPWPDLAAVAGTVSTNGAAVDRGSGRDVLGHPLQSVAWLAGHLAAAGGLLRAGDVVMTGNMVTTKFPAASSRWRFDVSGLGSVDLAVGP